MRPRRTRQSDSNLLKVGIPRSFLQADIEDFNTYGSKSLQEVKDFVENYIENLDYNFIDNKGIFFFGSNGVGKSFLSCIILRQAYWRRYSVRRTTFSDYINEHTRIWNAKSVSEKEIMEEKFYYYYKAPEFLVIEEVGKELDTKLSPTVLEDLLRYREEHGLPTIICTNLAPSILVQSYGNSIASLIKGNFTPVNIVGKDNRQSVFAER